MAARKFTRSKGKKTPLKGGNRIRTHPRRAARAEGAPYPSVTFADQMRVEAIKQCLLVVSAGIVACVYTLKLKHRIGDNEPVIVALRDYVIEELGRIHKQMNSFDFAADVRAGLAADPAERPRELSELINQFVRKPAPNIPPQTDKEEGK